MFVGVVYVLEQIFKYLEAMKVGFVDTPSIEKQFLMPEILTTST